MLRLLTEADAAAHRALRTMSIRESPQLACPRIVSELSIYVRLGCGVLTGHMASGTRVWGAFDGGQLVGSVSVSQALERANRGKAQLWGLYVAPAHRGNRIADALVSAALEWCRQDERIGAVTLHVHRDNRRALRWFERCGFTHLDDESLRATQLVAMRMRAGASKDFPALSLVTTTDPGAPMSPRPVCRRRG